MSNPTPSLKQRAHELVDQLPDDATWDDVIKEARFRKAVEEGVAAADRGDFANPDEVRACFAKWGITPGNTAESLSVAADIEAGLADSEADRVTSNNEVRRRFGLPALPE